jgi:hypothetical protein
MNDEARHKQLLELLKQGQSETTWRAIYDLFASWPEGEEKAKSLIVADQALSVWDDRLRHVFSAWGHLFVDEKLASVARLARSIEIYRREQYGSSNLWGIVNSEHAQNLKYLIVISSDLSRAAVKALSDSPYLTNLQHLEINRTFLFGESLEQLFQARGLPSLRTLKLVEVGLKPEPLKSLGQATHFSNLREIDFSVNLLKSEGLSILSQSSWLTSIEKLELRGNHIEDDGIIAFTKSPYLKALMLLDLSGNPVTEAGKKMLLDVANREGFKLII